jgi:hypothetical protein
VPESSPGPSKDARGALHGVAADASATEWSALELRAASIRVAAVAICLAAGMAAGLPKVGMAATTGAFPTGFGAIHRLWNVPGLPMLAAALGMGFCASLGALAGSSTLSAAIVGGLIATACGFATAFGQASWWFTLQWSVAFFLATAAPAGLLGAAEHGALVFCGGGGLRGRNSGKLSKRRRCTGDVAALKG